LKNYAKYSFLYLYIIKFEKQDIFHVARGWANL